MHLEGKISREPKATIAAYLYLFATNSCKCSLTSVSAMRSLSSCKLLLIRALLFFSTSGFLACQRNGSSGSPSLRSMVNSWHSQTSSPFCLIRPHLLYPHRRRCCAPGPCRRSNQPQPAEGRAGGR